LLSVMAASAAAAAPLDEEDDVVFLCETGPSADSEASRKRQRLNAPAKPSALLGLDGLGFRLLSSRYGADVSRSDANRFNAGSVSIVDLMRQDASTGVPRFHLFSTMILDLEWLLSVRSEASDGSLLPKLFLLLPPGSSDFGNANLKVEVHCPLILDRYGHHHSKFCLSVFPSFLRFWITSANTSAWDHECLTAAVWAQDFPLKTPASPPSSAFEDSLLSYLEKTGWVGGLGTRDVDWVDLNAFKLYDFSNARAALVASVPGYHSGGTLRSWGHMRVRALLEAEPPFPAALRGADLVIQHSSASGSRVSAFNAILASFAAGAGLGPPATESIIWPTMEEVRRSDGGWASGGSIPTTDIVYDSLYTDRLCRWGPPDGMPPCPVRGARSGDGRPDGRPGRPDGGRGVEGRGLTAPHAKTVLRHRGEEIAWCYIGSHNWSLAAWGTSQKDGTQLWCPSFELGVLLLPSLQPRDAEGQPLALTPSAHGGLRLPPGRQGDRVVLPVPFSLPPVRYGAADVPWHKQRVPAQQVDSRGRPGAQFATPS